jgi:DNA-binding PadR family transcriptional regulator
VRLGLGTLYGAIARLEERGLIESAGDEPRRRPYRLTATGEIQLAKAVEAMDTLAREGAARLGLELSAVRRRGRLGWSL